MSDIELVRRRFDCPIEWCDGVWMNHGGFGQDPDRWEHYGIAYVLPHGAFIAASSQGAEPVELTVHLDQDATEALPPARASAVLRMIADAIDQLQLDA